MTIQDALLRKAKAASVERNCTVGEVIEDALRTALAARQKEDPSKRERPLKTFKGTGTLPGIDLDSNGSVQEAMEGR